MRARRARCRRRNLRALELAQEGRLGGRERRRQTTIVKLLARLYDPNEGRVLLDGKDLRDYDLADYRLAPKEGVRWAVATMIGIVNCGRGR